MQFLSKTKTPKCCKPDNVDQAGKASKKTFLTCGVVVPHHYRLSTYSQRGFADIFKEKKKTHTQEDSRRRVFFFGCVRTNNSARMQSMTILEKRFCNRSCEVLADETFAPSKWRKGNNRFTIIRSGLWLALNMGSFFWKQQQQKVGPSWSSEEEEEEQGLTTLKQILDVTSRVCRRERWSEIGFHHSP